MKYPTSYVDRCLRLLRAAILALALLACALAPSASQAAPAGPILSIQVDGVLTAPSFDYIRRAIQQAESARATVLIINLRSEGGVLRDARVLAQQIAQAKVPVAVFVAPAGTDAGPTGAILLSAAHISAMAPGTTFGSPYPLAQIDASLTQQTADLLMDSLTQQIRQWNEAQGRSTAWVDQAVRSGAIFTNQQAVAASPPAITMVAADQAQLVAQMHGRTVALAGGAQATLTTLGQPIQPIAPTTWEGLRMLLAQPTLAFALLIIGAILVSLEFATPGITVFAGSGAVLILAGLAGLLMLPLQLWALAVLVLALVALVAEFITPFHGALAVVGIVLMVVAGLNLIDPAQAPGSGVSLWAVLGLAVALGTAVAAAVVLALRVRAKPAVTGQEALVGMVAEVRRPLDPQGMVYVDGALWSAICQDGSAAVGDHVKVVGFHHMQLIVQHLDNG